LSAADPLLKLKILIEVEDFKAANLIEIDFESLSTIH